MESVALDVERVHLGIGHLDPGGVGIGVEETLDSQAGGRGGGGDQAQDDGVADEGLAAPVLADEGKEAMLDLGAPERITYSFMVV